MKTSFFSLLLVSHLIAGVLLMTTPNLAQSTTITTTTVETAKVAFELLSTTANATVEWPRVVSVTTYVGGDPGDLNVVLPLWCVVITTVIVIIVAGVLYKLIMKCIKCIMGLNPTNRFGTNLDIVIGGMPKIGINAVTGTNSPGTRAIESGASGFDIFTSTNLNDWVPYFNVSNIVQQMVDGSCRLVSTVYKENVPVLTNSSWLNFDTNSVLGQFTANTTSDFSALTFDFKGSPVGFVGVPKEY